MLIAGFWAGLVTGDDREEILALQESATDLRIRYEQVAAQRDRLRAERNALEARLAAQKAPAVCPRPFVSTAELVAEFTVDYPCGWHVALQPLTGDAHAERPGIHPTIAFFSRLPISLAPKPTPPGDIEVADWTDDAGDEQDALQPLAVWVEEERARFSTVKQDAVEAGPLPGVRLSGTLAIEEPTDAVVTLWEYTDRGGVRHVMRLFSLAPSPEVREAIDRMVRSFRPTPR